MRTSLTRIAAGTAIAAAAVLTVAGTASAATSSPTDKAAHTTLSIAEATASIKAGQKDIVGGVLSAGMAPVAGQTVWLDRLTGRGGSVVALQDGQTGRNGRVLFVVAPKTTTTYVLVFAGARKLAPTHSGIVTVVVKR